MKFTNNLNIQNTYIHKLIHFFFALILLFSLTSCGMSPQPTLEKSATTLPADASDDISSSDSLSDAASSNSLSDAASSNSLSDAASSGSSSDTATGDMTIHFLDVGQGLSILVESQDDILLYDGGDRSHSSMVVSYLKQQDITTIDYLISSHYDEDHVSGLIGCLNVFEVETVIGADYVHDSKLYDSFVSIVSDKNLEILHPQVGTEFPFGTGSFTILSPETLSNDSNNNSVAIKLTNGSHSFLFMGDVEHKSETAIIASGIDLSCTILCLGHHGSANSTSWDFLKATVPEYAVISCGTDNKYGHPDEDIMEKLSSMEIPLFRTDKQGNIIVGSDGTSIHWNVEPCNDYTPGNAVISDSLTETTDSQTFPPSEGSATSSVTSQEEIVWISSTGAKFHRIADCGEMNPETAMQLTKTEALSQEYEACKKCY